MTPLPPIVVLCGGFGTRLRDVVPDRPKVLAEVAGRPFLAHLLDRLRSEGAGEVVLSAGHLADQVEAFVAGRPTSAEPTRVVAEQEPLGTAGALRFAAHAAGIEGDFLALNGDTYFSGSLRTLAAHHAAGDGVATVAVAHVADAGRYGAVRFDGAGHVTGFDEKSADGPGWINAGVYCLSPEALSHLRPGTPASLERDILPSLIGRGLAALPYPEAVFLDIGTPADYARAEQVLQSRTTQ